MLNNRFGEKPSFLEQFSPGPEFIFWKWDWEGLYLGW